MKRKILIQVLLAIMLAFAVFIGACSEHAEVEEVKTDSMFEVIKYGSALKGEHYNVVYHKETKVMYAVSNGNKAKGVFTVLVNPDGTPMLWEEN